MKIEEMYHPHLECLFRSAKGRVTPGLVPRHLLNELMHFGTSLQEFLDTFLDFPAYAHTFPHRNFVVESKVVYRQSSPQWLTSTDQSPGLERIS